MTQPHCCKYFGNKICLNKRDTPKIESFFFHEVMTSLDHKSSGIHDGNDLLALVCDV